MRHTCPACGRAWEVPDNLVGRKVTCQDCGKESFAGFSAHRAPRAQAPATPPLVQGSAPPSASEARRVRQEEIEGQRLVAQGRAAEEEGQRRAEAAGPRLGEPTEKRLERVERELSRSRRGNGWLLAALLLVVPGVALGVWALARRFPTPMSTAQAAPGGIPSSGMTALAALKRLEARTEVGITRPDYTRECGEMWATVKAFKNSRDADTRPDFTTWVLMAAEAYRMAADRWNRGVQTEEVDWSNPMLADLQAGLAKYSAALAALGAKEAWVQAARCLRCAEVVAAGAKLPAEFEQLVREYFEEVMKRLEKELEDLERRRHG